MEKICKLCKTNKSLSEFLCAPSGAAVAHGGTSTYCKECHAEGSVAHGYGAYGKNYRFPGDGINA